MKQSKYIITCMDCGAFRMVGIVKTRSGDFIDWLDNNPDAQLVKIVSGRLRLDSNWGWECICGNDDILTNQEKEYISNKQNPDPKEIAELAKKLVPEKPKFKMEEQG